MIFIYGFFLFLNQKIIFGGDIISIIIDTMFIHSFDKKTVTSNLNTTEI